MKINISINQQGIASLGLAGKTDLIDWAILDYIKDWYFLREARRIEISEEDGRRISYVWINYSHLLTNMPLLSEKNPKTDKLKKIDKNRLTERLRRLERLNLIRLFRAPDNTIYVRLTELYAKAAFLDEDPPVLKTVTVKNDSPETSMETDFDCPQNSDRYSIRKSSKKQKLTKRENFDDRPVLKTVTGSEKIENDCPQNSDSMEICKLFENQELTTTDFSTEDTCPQNSDSTSTYIGTYISTYKSTLGTGTGVQAPVCTDGRGALSMNSTYSSSKKIFEKNSSAEKPPSRDFINELVDIFASVYEEFYALPYVSTEKDRRGMSRLVQRIRQFRQKLGLSPLNTEGMKQEIAGFIRAVFTNVTNRFLRDNVSPMFLYSYFNQYVKEASNYATKFSEKDWQEIFGDGRGDSFHAPSG